MKALLKNIKRVKSVPILNYVMVRDRLAYTHSIDSVVIMPMDQNDGLYNIELVKAGIWKNDESIQLSDFPDINQHKAESTDSVSNVLLESLEWVHKASGYEQVRPYLNGVLFDQFGLVATDGTRLHKVKHQSNIGNGRYLLPNNAIDLIITACKESKEKSFYIEFSSGYYNAAIGDYIIRGALIDSTFPEYGRVIPNMESVDPLPFSADEFKAALKISKAVAKSEKAKSPKALFLGGEWRAMRGGELLPYISLKPPFDIAFNCELLADVGIDGSIYFAPNDNRAPIMIEHREKTAVVMPFTREY